MLFLPQDGGRRFVASGRRIRQNGRILPIDIRGLIEEPETRNQKRETARSACGLPTTFGGWLAIFELIG
jgi:hypothetical protein